MSTFKVTSINTYWDNTISTIIVTAPNHNFKVNDFVTLHRSNVSVLNGSFRVIAVSKEYFTVTAPFGPISNPDVTYMYVSLVDTLSITPKIFSEVEIGMPYLYGLSDFWSVMFEGSDKIDLLMEANAQQASDIYNKFLQLASTISLDELQVTINSELKLVILGPDNLVEGTTATYYLPEKILYADFVLNRPFLPTLTLEKGTHFDISDDGEQITFFQPLDYLSFPLRKTSTVEKEYSLWFSNCKVDEQLISKYYGRLLQLDPQVSTEKFKAFVYGLFYLFAHGPNIAFFRKGLNLSLGLPLARDYEVVIDIRNYLETNQYLVITDLNQYIVPYGIEPSVEIGDNLVPSQEIAQWVEIKDWINDGTWWANLYIPEQLIPYLPDGEVDRHATPGSYAEYAMATFLKQHTFLVNVNVTNFKDIQNFQELYDLIYRAKPTYTFPIYIWSVPITEILPLVDELTDVLYMAEWCENLSLPIERMKRNLDSTLQLLRGCPQFIRCQVSNNINEQMGGSELINGNQRELNAGIITGYINYRYQYEGPDLVYNSQFEMQAWKRTLLSRGDPTWRPKKSLVVFNANPDYVDNSGVKVNLWNTGTMRVVPLYITSVLDMQEKFDTLGLGQVTSAWIIPIYKPTSSGTPINVVPINELNQVDYSGIIKANFNTLFFKGTNISSPGNFIPRQALSATYAPPSPNDIRTYDYLLMVRIYEKAVGMYWVTSNWDLDIFPYFVVDSFDQLVITTTGNTKINRGIGPLGNPYYLLRGAGLTVENTDIIPINYYEINGQNATTNMVENSFSDDLNLVQVMDRSGKMIVVRKDLL